MDNKEYLEILVNICKKIKLETNHIINKNEPIEQKIENVNNYIYFNYARWYFYNDIIKFNKKILYKIKNKNTKLQIKHNTKDIKSIVFTNKYIKNKIKNILKTFDHNYIFNMLISLHMINDMIFKYDNYQEEENIYNSLVMFMSNEEIFNKALNIIINNYHYKNINKINIYE